MKLVAILSGLVRTVRVVAELSPRLLDQMGVAAAILLTVLGVVMHWHLPRQQMSMEERVKDGKISEDQARREIRFYTRCAPIATLLGVVVLMFVLFDLSQ